MARIRDPQPHPLHPAAGVSSLVPRLGHGQQRLLPLLAENGITTTMSPLHFMAHNRELSLFALGERPLGLCLDPMTNLRQVPADYRGKTYLAQAYGRGPTFDPDRDSISATELVELAEVPIDLQRAHGGTLLVNTYHLCGAASSRGRRLDLHFAEIGAEHFRAERMDEPPPLSAVRVERQFFAALAVQREVVESPREVESLAAAYAALDVAGFLVKIEGFWERAPSRLLRGAGALLGALSDAGRPVISSGPGGLHLPLLVADISCSVGIGESERFTVPDTDRPRREGPRIHTAYHPSFMRSVNPRAQPARAAFAAAPCRCNRHDGDSPPEGRATDEHTALVRACEAREATRGTVEERREWLEATSNLATHLAHDSGVDVVPYATYAAVLDGIDAGRGELARSA